MFTLYELRAGRYIGEFKEFSGAEKWGKKYAEEYEPGAGYSIWAVEYDSDTVKEKRRICIVMK